MKLKSYSIVEGITLRFLHFDQYIFPLLLAIRVLHGCIYLAEDAQIIQTLLRAQHIELAQWGAGLDLQVALHDKGTRIVQSGYKHLSNEHLLALVDGKCHIHTIRCACRRLGSSLKGGIRKTTVIVVIEQNLSVGSDIRFREWLIRQRV